MAIAVLVGQAASPAAATVDSGRTASLFALVGDPATHALMGYCDVAEGGCSLFLIELSATEFRRVEVRESEDLPSTLEYEDPRAPIREYLASLPESLREELTRAGVRSAPGLRIVERTPNPAEQRGEVISTVPPHVVEMEQGVFEAAVRVNSRVPSMAAADVLNGEYCYDRSKCPSCVLRERTLDGETTSSYVCPPNAPDPECDCRAEAEIVRFAVTHRATSTVGLGNRWLVAPYALAQVMEGEERGQPASMLIEINGFRGVDTGDALLFWGGAAHEPTNNGSYFPIIAVVHLDSPGDEGRSAPEPTPAAEAPSEPRPPNAADPTEPPTEAPANDADPSDSGCGGCAATRPASQIAWPLALLLLVRRRR